MYVCHWIVNKKEGFCSMKRTAIGAALLLLAGCTMPTTPDQFRELAKSSSFGRIDNYTVNVPYRTAMARISKQAKKCLAIKVTQEITECSNTCDTYEHVYYYKPTMVGGKTHGELDLQQSVEGHVIAANTSEMPKDGWYILVADIYPEGKDKTRLDVSRGLTLDKVSNAIRHWADKSNMGCPDLSKI